MAVVPTLHGSAREEVINGLDLLNEIYKTLATLPEVNPAGRILGPYPAVKARSILSWETLTFVHDD